MIPEGSGLSFPIQVGSPFKIISIITVFQLAKVEDYSVKEEGGVVGLHNWPV